MDRGRSSSRAASLLPRKAKGLAAKRPWKKQPSQESLWTNSSDDHPRGRSPTSRRPVHVPEGQADVPGLGGSDVEDGEDDDDGGDGGGDGDEDAAASLRPHAPSTHPSQIGHLTTSSPIIQADHRPEVQGIQHASFENIPSSMTSTLPANDSSSDLARSRPASSTGLQVSRDESSRRSKSPAGRIKDVFRSRKNLGAVPSTGSQAEIAQTAPSLAPSRSPTLGSSTLSASTTQASQSSEDGIKIAPPSLERNPQRKGLTATEGGSDLPRTPPSGDHQAPVIVSTPPTPIDRDLPHEATTPARQGPAAQPEVKPTATVDDSPPRQTIASRRMRSGSGASVGPSKLSNTTLPPLTPLPENTGPSTPGGGFFSTVLSAAQNAANQLSNPFNANIGPGGNKTKGNAAREPRTEDDDKTDAEPSVEQAPHTKMGDKELAVKTLGQGDLSLSQLGIHDNGNASSTAVASKPADSGVQARGRSESAPTDPAAVVAVVPVDGDAPPDGQGVPRPASSFETTGQAERTPPSSVYEDKSGLRRSGSIRSALGRRRARGSTNGTVGTAGTGVGGTPSTIGAASAVANTSFAQPVPGGGGAPKLTGFAVASKKRNRDFHALFKSVPDDDYLIEDYSCALQREILAHGRLYVSEGHLCFSSNIFGWVTTLVMSFDEIVSVEKRSTALVFKNGLMISTLHAKHVFASFTSRDSTYDLIVNIWKLGHPTLRSSLNGVSLDETGGDKTEKVEDGEAVASQTGSESEVEGSEDGEDIYDEDEDDDVMLDATQAPETSPVEPEGDEAVARKAAGAVAANGATEKPKEGATTTTTGDSDFPGPAAHAPTDCGDVESHYDKTLWDDTIPAPLGKVYNLVFGPASVAWMTKWLTAEQKCFDLQLDDKKGLSPDNKTRALSYIKPLNASIGPKQTKCIVTETLENFDLEKSVNVHVATQNPDVPNGNIFSVKTKYCLTWAENNSTRMQINCTIEWTGKSWLKGPIEKGANEGQTQYCKDLFTGLKLAVSSLPRSGMLPNGAAKGKKKKHARGKLVQAAEEKLEGVIAAADSKALNWGLFEPLHGLLGPVVDIIRPVMTGNVVYGVLVGLLVAMWFGFGFNPGQARSGREMMGFMGYPDRIAAYEEIWRREESDLWDWLEERVDLHRMSEGAMPVRQRAVEPRTVEERVKEDRMGEREIEEAIRITEEKLQVLKSVVGRRQTTNPASGPRFGRPTNHPTPKR